MGSHVKAVLVGIPRQIVFAQTEDGGSPPRKQYGRAGIVLIGMPTLLLIAPILAASVRNEADGSPPRCTRKRLWDGTLHDARVLQYLGHVERLQLIALIDAEIERLQQARLLIAQSVVSSRLRNRPEKTLLLQTDVKTRIARTVEQKTSPSSDISSPQEQPAVSVTRIPARQRSGSRSPRRTKQIAPKTGTALTGAVPLHPVAAPPRRDEEINQGKPAEKNGVDSVSLSSFGQAISRGLAGLNH